VVCTAIRRFAGLYRCGYDADYEGGRSKDLAALAHGRSDPGLCRRSLDLPSESSPRVDGGYEFYLGSAERRYGDICRVVYLGRKDIVVQGYRNLFELY